MEDSSFVLLCGIDLLFGCVCREMYQRFVASGEFPDVDDENPLDVMEVSILLCFDFDHLKFFLVQIPIQDSRH